jgi:two-component system, NarL family, nitrate/nitrite response regulator NarL
VRVLAADSYPLYRDGVVRAIKSRPELELVAATGDGREALHAIELERPDVALVDLGLGGLSGEQILNAVRRDGLPTRIVLVAADADPGRVYAAIAKGAAGYLTKDANASEVCDAVTAVARGTTVLAPQLQTGVFAEIRLRSLKDRPFLTDRERQVLRLMADGLSSREIGERLRLGTATVKTHQQHVYEKLDVRERAAAVAAAMRRGLLE